MFNKFKSTVLVVIAVLGVLDGTALAQEVVVDADNDPEWKRVAQQQEAERQRAARKAAEEKARKRAQQEWDDSQKKAEEEKRGAEEKSAAESQSSEVQALPQEVPHLKLEEPKLDISKMQGSASATAGAEQASKKEFVVPDPPAREESEPEYDPSFPLWLDQPYFVPYAQGGFATGFSPKGKEQSQTAPTVTYAGASGKATLAEYAIFEYRFNLYFGKDDQGKVEMREMFFGMRFPIREKFSKKVAIDPWIHLGKQEDIGEAGFLYQTGSVADARTMLRNTFARPGWSLIGGITFYKYVQFLGEFNADYDFRAAVLNTQYTWSGPRWKLQSLSHFGYRTAKDELGKIYQADLGFKATINPEDKRPVEIGLVGGFERHTDLVTAEEVKQDIKGEKLNVILGQLAVSYFNFTLLYTEGQYVPLAETRGGYRNLHLEYKFDVPKAKLAAIPFVSAGYAQNVSLFRVPKLAPEPGLDTAYPVFQVGLRVTLGTKDRSWPYN